MDQNDLNTLSGRFSEWLERSFESGPSLVLATEGRVSARTVANWKSGGSEPGADALRILHEMGCNVTWLVTGFGESMFADNTRGRFWAERSGDKASGTAEQPRKTKQPAPKKAPAEMIAELEAVIEKWR